MAGRAKYETLYDEAVLNLYGFATKDGDTWQTWRRQLDEVMGEGFYVKFWCTYTLTNTERRRLETFAGPHGPTMRKVYLIQKAKRDASRKYSK